MKNFIFFNPLGTATQSVNHSSDDVVYIDGNHYFGLLCKEASESEMSLFGTGRAYLKSGTVKVAPEKPDGSFYQWSIDLEQWIDPRTLDDLKEEKWTEVKAARDAFEFGSFTHNALEFDCNQISQQRIGQAAQAAMFALSVSQSFSQDWTLKDNSVVTLDAQQMINVALAMGQHISQAHSQSRLLRTAIYGATTPEEVQAITW